MRLRYSSRARTQIEAIYDFLAEQNPVAAGRIVADIRMAARRLIVFPAMGREGEVAGTREWVVHGSPYVIVYKVLAERSELWVLGVFHGAQDRRDQIR